MPELPEVEVIRRGLLPHVTGRRVLSINCSDKQLRLPLPARELVRWVKGAVIEGIERRGKYLLFHLDNHAGMIVHLGMSGKLGLFAADAPAALHDHARFVLNSPLQMRYNDARRFGCIQVLSPERLAAADPFASLGREPLDERCDADYLKSMAGKRLQPVKNFLMDSRMVAGIGNIYANEILFLCNLHPTTPIGSIDHAGWRQIARTIRKVLLRAIECGGSTISDFVDSSGRSGYFQLELAVYGHEGQPCPRCGAPIEKQVIAGRSSFFCPRCQS